MSWSLSYQLKCDGQGKDEKECVNWSDASLSREECVEWAKKCGWLVGTRKHYCPKCRILNENRKKIISIQKV